MGNPFQTERLNVKSIIARAAIVLALAGFGIYTPCFAQGVAVTGEVLETRAVESYTYLRLKTKDGEVWAAVPRTEVTKGAQVTVENPMTMRNFESKALNKKFDSIVFGQLAGAGAKNLAPHPAMPASAVSNAAIKVAKAAGPDARTVAEVVKGKVALRGKTVLVHAQVVKVSNAIMGKNWVHLQDGSGSGTDGTNDIVVTTKDMVAVGDVVHVKGTVRTEVDIGGGYNYAVLIEDAAVRK
jgi:hypothetical protein